MISLAQANSLLTHALAHARARNAMPMAVMVLDAGGQPVAFMREDGASSFRHDIAHAKAFGSLGMGVASRVLAERAKTNPIFFQSVSAAVQGKIVFSPGGVLIRDNTGSVIGAIGVSGDTGEIDEACACAGIEACGLRHGEVL